MIITTFLKFYVPITCAFSELREKTQLLREEVVKCLCVTSVRAVVCAVSHYYNLGAHLTLRGGGGGSERLVISGQQETFS